MNDDIGDDERMRALFRDAVSDVEPHDGLAEVRRRTRARRTSSARRWAPVLVGAGAVAATVVVASVVVSGLGSDDPDDQPPVAGSSSTEPSTGPSTDLPSTTAAGIYFIGESPSGPRLYREFQVVGRTPDPAQQVLLALQRLDAGPRDPDYQTVWPADSFRAVAVEDDQIVVELATDAALTPVGQLASYGVQQAVYTAEAALGETLPVAFERDGEPVRELFGLPVGARVERLRSYDLTAPVNITDPGEKLAVEDGTFVANGTLAANVQSAVRWSLFDRSDRVLNGRAHPIDITGSDAQATLYAPGWRTDEIDVSGLAPGEYVFVVTVTDVGQTSDTPREFSDTRTITLR